jgi:hypothetical protein
MNWEQEQKLRVVSSCGERQGAAVGMDTEARRPSLMERVSGQLERGRIESARACRLDELKYLLDKNPEVARILDLIEDVRG